MLIDGKAVFEPGSPPFHGAGLFHLAYFGEIGATLGRDKGKEVPGIGVFEVGIGCDDGMAVIEGEVVIGDGQHRDAGIEVELVGAQSAGPAGEGAFLKSPVGARPAIARGRGGDHHLGHG